MLIDVKTLCIPLGLVCQFAVAVLFMAPFALFRLIWCERKTHITELILFYSNLILVSDFIPRSFNCIYDQDASSAFGTVVGRVANRIANGSFVLDGKTIRLNKDGTTVLHGN